METLIPPPLSLHKMNAMVLVDRQKQSFSITSAQDFKDKNADWCYETEDHSAEDEPDPVFNC